MSVPMKQLASEMEQNYNPATVEQGWYSWWEKSGFFKPKSDRDPSLPADTKSFVIVIPPPNVTGYLHLGHALTISVQDTLIRYHRMLGDNTLYLPGTDHAGIATQVVVEKRVKAKTGKSRHDLGRDAFLKKIWEWKESHTGVIQQQLRRCGVSVDWDRERFTMDERCAEAVKESFVQLHEEGLVYRAIRLVNWCCALQSAISDLEVETEEVEKNARFSIPNYNKKVEMGTLTHVAYKVADSNEEIVIATTRPETILADVAVAVHPEDPRYNHLHGKMLVCPFRDEKIPLVTDSKLVEMEFGTGAVKITPAHDKNDFEAGKRHKLPSFPCFDLHGNICIEGEFLGMHRFDCRRAIVKALEVKGLLRGVEPYAYRIGICSRTKDIIEPMLMPQWFVNCESMAQKSVEAVKNGDLKIIPESHVNTWNHYLCNIEPWCVSRQLWWGHRIPAYEICRDCNPIAEDAWVVGRDLDEAKIKAKKRFNLSDEDLKSLEFNQDPAVLDTWFSSGLWPFSTMGWPKETDDLRRFFPGSLLETGHDIIFFWVARMVMMSLHFTGKLPFSEVYLHAMVRDREGRKMSKQLGNVIDPLDVVNGISLQALHDKLHEGNLDPNEIPRAEKFQKEAFPEGIAECGSDALRFGLLSYTQSGRNVNLDINRIIGYRQFCNKLWNVVRYILYFALELSYKPQRTDFTGVELPLECSWILSRLGVAISECRRNFTEGIYDFALATQTVYRFWLYELCDVFLELTKPIRSLDAKDPKRILVSDVLLYVVEAGLRMLHPMMPFITEELWQRLPHWENAGVFSIMIAAYPEPPARDETIEEEMKLMIELTKAARSMKASYNLTNKHTPDIWITSSNAALKKTIQNFMYIPEALAVLSSITALDVQDESKIPAGCGVVVINAEVSLHMMLKGFIDVEKEISKHQNNINNIQKQLEGVEKKMKLPNYETKVPENVRNADKKKQESLYTQLKQLVEGVEKLKILKN